MPPNRSPSPLAAGVFRTTDNRVPMLRVTSKSAANPFAHRPFALYWVSRVFATFAVQVVSVAVGWKVYDLTRDPFALGLVGLVQFLPSLLLVLFTGAVADRYSRRKIMAICLAVELLCTVTLLGLAWTAVPDVWPIYLTLAVLGVARAFFSPAMQALVPNLVPPEALSTAIAWNTSSWQLATVLGPVAGGLLYGISEQVAFGAAGVLFALSGILVLMIPRQSRGIAQKESAWTMVSAGFVYVSQNRIVLGAISLDLFAVLLGGAVALMPVYARDILDVGPWGLGLLRAAPGIGALAVTAVLVLFPIRSRAGHWMFLGVAVFGLATIGFGVSVVPWLSIPLLMVMGASDMISVYIRETLIQLATPDEVRGRVNAVNMVFIGASNELGEFRAGVVAGLIGVVPAVVIGGVGTVAVAALWAKWFPELRRAERLDRVE
jgi:MFS family permease